MSESTHNGTYSEEELYSMLEKRDLENAINNSPIEYASTFYVSSTVRRNKRGLLQALLRHNPYWHRSLSAIAVSKVTSLRAAEARQTRLQNIPVGEPENVSSNSTLDSSGFLELPTPEDVMKCLTEFYNATSNNALKELICAVCARRLNAKGAKFETIYLDELKNRHRLKPHILHPLQVLTGPDKLLLEQAGCTKDGDRWKVNVCKDCCHDLGKQKDLPPKYSLANNLWIGPVPWALQNLTIVEQLLIARVYPRVFVIKLFPKDNSRFGLREDQIQHGLRGNVTSFELNSEAIGDMLRGDLLPQPPAILASILSVTFIGRGKLPDISTRNLFRVRRAKVLDALKWLKYNNPKYYGSAHVDLSRLEQLPEDDVPPEVLANIRQEEDETVIQAGSEGYVPTGEDGEVYGDFLSACNTTEFSDDPDVIPLQHLGVMDNDLSEVRSSDLMEWALQNMSKQDPEPEYAYAVRHGGPVNTFGYARQGEPELDPDRENYWARSFPLLYTTGLGGIECDRPVKLSLLEHTRWSLCYSDRRFRLNETFMFTAFGIYQRRQAMLAARIQMRRKDFDSSARILDTITPDDLKKAADEEVRGLKPSNPAIRLLKEYIKATTRRVVGSNQARVQLRGQIWSTSMYLNPPTLWITINPDDLHDPIPQIFAGEEIDMDNFVNTAGPDKLKRSQNIARDPFAAAQFFNYLITAILEHLFAIKVTTRQVTSGIGVLGRVKGYFGTVECQGRGTLHLHLLIWLADAPPPGKLRDMLQTSEFRARIVTYLKANVRSYLPEIATPQQLEALPTQPEVAYSRPPDPMGSVNSIQARIRKLELDVVRTKQLHTCVPRRCLRYDKWGRVTCKRRAPWELSDTYAIESDGTYRTKRTLGYLNGYCPWISVAARCNQDIKMLTYGTETNHIAFYVTKYMAKEETRSHNTSSLLVTGLAHHYLKPANLKDIRERQRELIDRSVNILNREQEVPAPLVVTYLMGWGDVYRSHQYAVIYWGSFVSWIERIYPHLKQTRSDELVSTQEVENTQSRDDQDGEHSQIEGKVNLTANTPELEVEEVILQFNPAGKIYFRSQIDDYIYRGKEAAHYNVLDYFVGTYERSLQKDEDNLNPTENDEQHEDETYESGTATSRRPGRPAHRRIKYLSLHPRHETHLRVVRPHYHNTLPNLVGPRFPQQSDSDQEERHAAWSLTLLKPWRSLSDLKELDETWKSALKRFLQSAGHRVLDILDNLEHYHTCRIAAESKREHSGVVEEYDLTEEETVEGDNWGESEGFINSTSITPEMVTQATNEAENQRDVAHGRHAVEIARAIGVFKDLGSNVQSGVERATEEDMKNLSEWMKLLENDAKRQHLVAPTHDSDCGDVTEIICPSTSQSAQHGVIPAAVNELSVKPIEINNLYPEQQRAFKIVRYHLSQFLESRRQNDSIAPPQLLMLLVGEGGTGKSRVIQTISQEFAQNGATHMLLKAAYTGIAASLIDGKTTHHIASISVNNRKQTLSAEARAKLGEMWKYIEYLIIDEYSMLSKEFLSRLSRHITLAKMEYNTSAGDKPFGGVNVILCGDIYQFPPVAISKTGAIYHSVNNNAEEGIGQGIYQQFRTVTMLKQQVRVGEPEWRDFLESLRRGDVKEKHIEMLKDRVLTNPNRVETDFDSELWSNSCLITPRHSVRTRWNEAAVTQHCQKTGQQLYLCPAYDTCAGRGGRRPIALHEQYAAARGSKNSRNNGRLREKGGLPDVVPLAVGMKVMVTLNVETDLDVANGARGTIVNIALDPNEPPFEDPLAPVINLSRLPAYILVKLDRTRAATISGLGEGIIPLVASSKNYYISLSAVQEDGKTKDIRRSVNRLQFPITPAYAFTDYRSQGQTIPAAIVDIASPPTGNGLNLANLYVALSRCTGKDNIF